MSEVAPTQFGRRRCLWQGLAGGLLLWVALPPCDWWPVAWLAPVPWLLLVAERRALAWRDYRQLAMAGFIFWLLAVHWLRLPHWATSFGWLAMSAYLAWYLPAFVVLARSAVHTLGVPLWLAAPIVWTGLEWARSHLLSGFSMAALGHTQARWIELIQISDLAGGYLVSFVVMMTAALLTTVWKAATWPRRAVPLFGMVVLLASCQAYGTYRCQQPTVAGPLVALVQGSIDADWKQDPQKAQRIFREYFELSEQAVRQAPEPVQLVVWPETMYRRLFCSFEPEFRSDKITPDDLRKWAAMSRQEIAQIARRLDAPLLLGTDAIHFSTEHGEQHFNAAICTDRQGAVLGRYDKMHLVMFGEYIPFARQFPWLYQFSPVGGGLDAGSSPQSFLVEGIRYAPNICYESVIPHVIHRQLRVLRQADQMPDVLVNLTNDAWFWGSSELDMHLVCGVFRAVECRRPLLIAANGGISASIDSTGRIVQQSPRRTKDVIHAQVRLDRRDSLYLRIGDWPAGLCLLAAGWFGWFGYRRRRLE